jgi:hypothetical protein
MFFEPLLTGDVWWLVVNKRRRRLRGKIVPYPKIAQSKNFLL